jgi:hypothetical protein
VDRLFIQKASGFTGFFAKTSAILCSDGAKSALAKHRINLPTINITIGVMPSNRGLPLLQQARLFFGRLTRCFFGQMQYSLDFVNFVSRFKICIDFHELGLPTKSMGYCV